MSTEQLWITPEWPAPSNVAACSTTRLGGVSEAPFDTLNLGDHVGDKPDAVAANRQRVTDQLQLPNPPVWLEQVHGTTVQYLDDSSRGKIQADASYSDQAGIVCAVMTADCLPVLLCDRAGSQVAAIHAGWRGLCAGIIEQTVKQMGLPSDQLMAWLGPAIGPGAFEVGEEVVKAFVDHSPSAKEAFKQQDESHWLADIYQLARLRLAELGITAIYGGDRCTYQEGQQFFSYRRDGQCGRMASLIYLAS